MGGLQDFSVSPRPFWVYLNFRSCWDLIGVGPWVFGTQGLGPGLDKNNFDLKISKE